MHFHICPQEIAIFLMVYDQLQLYIYHYSHVMMAYFGRSKPDDCELCEQEEV